MDPIANMLSQIKNALAVKKDKVEVPYSKIKEEVAKTLSQEGHLGKVKAFMEEGSPHKKISIELKYDEHGEPEIAHLGRISKPGLRIYKKKTDLKPILRGLGTQIVSTSSGIMTAKEAKKRNLGGESICEVW